MTPDPAFLFLTTAHREALAGVTYSILSRKGFVVLTGDAGTGKTTLLTRIFQSIPSSRVRFSVILNPTLTPSEFLELALLDFGIGDIPPSKAQRLLLLQQFLLESHRKGQVVVLVVDEAHKLPPDVLEEIRLLSNFELAEAKLLQIVLAGQTELGEVLNRQDMRQLKQRIAMRLMIHPLSSTGVEHYVEHRWQKAGSTKPHPFRPDALAHIAQYSRGIPRLVNALCDNALMLAYAEGITAIGGAQISEVARDLDMVEVGIRPAATPVPARHRVQPGRAGEKSAPRTPERKQSAPAPVNGHTNTLPTANPPASAPVPTLTKYQGAKRPNRWMRLASRLGISSKPITPNPQDV